MKSYTKCVCWMVSEYTYMRKKWAKCEVLICFRFCCKSHILSNRVCGDTEATRRLHKPYQVNLIYSQRSIDVHDSIIPFIDAFLAHFYIRVVCFVNRIFRLCTYQFGLFVWLEFLHTVVDYMWPCLEIKFQRNTKAAMFKLNFSIIQKPVCRHVYGVLTRMCINKGVIMNIHVFTCTFFY